MAPRLLVARGLQGATEIKFVTRAVGAGRNGAVVHGLWGGPKFHK
jgi:hypothetical protein